MAEKRHKKVYLSKYFRNVNIIATVKMAPNRIRSVYYPFSVSVGATGNYTLTLGLNWLGISICVHVWARFSRDSQRAQHVIQNQVPHRLCSSFGLDGIRRR